MKLKLVSIHSEVEDQNSNLEWEHVRSSEDVTDKVSPQSKPLKEAKIFIPKFEKMKKMVIKDDSFWHDQVYVGRLE